MSDWLFIFGRTPQLSLNELIAVSPLPVSVIAEGVARISDQDGRISPESMIRTLGGTVKIARVLGTCDTPGPEALTEFLAAGDRESVTFGVSGYGETDGALGHILPQIKHALAVKGIRSRYVSASEGGQVSSVVITKQHVEELIVVRVGNEYLVGKTAAVQDFEAWNQRDYGRPFADPRSGMLPPKVARMAVNIATVKEKRQTEKGNVLLDPFCGMGTILAEAVLTGWEVFGSDQSPEVVEKAKKNLAWLGRKGTMFACDATHISEHVPAESVDSIVTEPYLGPASVTAERAKDIIKGLEKLYIGCLREWYGVLKPEGIIVIAMPQYAVSGRTYFVKNVIDRCETLGYTVMEGPLTYSREHAIVSRKFYVLKRIRQ